MPISLDPKLIDRWAHVPKYRQLADVLRQAIEDGRLEPGEALPSEAEIGEATELSRTTVRDAVNVLEAEGRIVKTAGKSTRVARLAPERRLMSGRYAEALQRLHDGTAQPGESSWSRDYGVAPEGDPSYSRDPATAGDAKRLHLEPGEEVLRRRVVKHAHGFPVQIQESVMPWSLVEGTPVADPDHEPFPEGTIGELWSLGLRVTRVVEEVTARLPRDEERRDLDMEAVGPVWEITRQFFVDGRPVEASEVIVSTARNILRYETDLSSAIEDSAD